MDIWDAFFLLLISIPLIMTWADAMFDVFRRDDMSGWKKALWLAASFVLRFFGTLLYVIVRPTATAGPTMCAVDDPFVPERPAADDPAEQRRVVSDLHDRGKLDDSEFAESTRRILESPNAAREG